MIPLGVSRSTLADFQAALVGNHEMRVGVQTMTLSGSYEANLTHRLLDGQVNVDYGADVTRSATVTLFDPTRSLSFDSDSPAEAALFMDRMLRITYGVLVNGAWVDVPVFTGPITSLSRDGDTIQVEAQGKEVLAMGAVWRPLTIRQGTRKSDAIRMILRERAGETVFSIPDLASRVPKTYTLGREAVAWKEARSLAASLGRQLFYDGRGTCRLRGLGGHPLFTWASSAMLSPLQITYSGDTVNAVFVTGGTPKGKKLPVTGAAVAQASHPLSPQRLGRNGVPRYLMSTSTNDKLRTSAECADVAEGALSRGLLQSVSATFDAMPVPHLDPGDVVRAHSDEGSVSFYLRTFSLPLTVGNPMSVGQLRNVSVKRRRRNK